MRSSTDLLFNENGENDFLKTYPSKVPENVLKGIQQIFIQENKINLGKNSEGLWYLKEDLHPHPLSSSARQKLLLRQVQPRM